MRKDDGKDQWKPNNVFEVQEGKLYIVSLPFFHILINHIHQPEFLNCLICTENPILLSILSVIGGMAHIKSHN